MYYMYSCTVHVRDGEDERKIEQKESDHTARVGPQGDGAVVTDTVSSSPLHDNEDDGMPSSEHERPDDQPATRLDACDLSLDAADTADSNLQASNTTVLAACDIHRERAEKQPDVDVDVSAPPPVDGVHAVLLTRRTPALSTSCESSLLAGLAATLKLSEEQTSDTRENTERPAPAVVTTDAEQPVNEFTERIFLLGFPHLFLLGKGDGGRTSDDLARHVLLWHDGRFANDDRFVFYCYNMKQRWCAARGVSLKVKNDRRSFEAFQDLVNCPDFAQRLEQAISRPDHPDTTRLVGMLMPLSMFHIWFGC